MLYIGKIVIDTVANTVSSGTSQIDLTHLVTQPLLLWALVGFVVLNFVQDSIQTLVGLQQGNLRDRLVGIAQAKVIEKIASYDDLSLFEQPTLLNTVQLANQGVERLPQLAGNVAGLLTGIFAFLPALLFSFAIEWWVPVVLFVTALPAIIVHGRVEENSWSVESSQAENVRHRNLTERVLSTSRLRVTN